MPLPGGYLIDTNIVVAFIRNNDLGKYIDQTYNLTSGANAFMLSVVSVGELHALSRKFGWGPTKLMILTKWISVLTVIDINDTRVLQAYGEIDAACDAAGRPMGKNDVWIAATARVTNTTLLTSDKDFDYLHGTWIDRAWIDPTSKP